MKKSVYIHIPFCKSKCNYCDFYSVTDIALIDDYVEAVLRNIGNINHEINSVYFGGGTPSLLKPRQIHRIIKALPVTSNAEITIEINPDDIMASHDYITGIKSAGVNRLSFGVQSLADRELETLGRRHNAKTTVEAISIAASVFDNISVDIMLGLPGQSMNSLSETIAGLLKLPIKALSAYMLKIEPNTPFSKNLDIIKTIPRDDMVADMYLYAVDTLEKCGFMQYEISNFAKPGYECRHNLKYWKLEDYYGIGTTAHACINGVRTACNMNINEFIKAQKQEITITDEKPGGYFETLMLNLRLTQTGFDTKKYSDKSDEILKKAKPFIKAGLINENNGIITLTPKGCLVSNEVIVKLL